MRKNYFRYLILTLTITSLSGPGGGMAQTALTTFETNDFSGSGICALCHSGLTDEALNDVSNDAHWRSKH